jgi:hypothetical protein
MDASTSAKFKALLTENNIDAAIALRRTAFAARAAGIAVATTPATAGGFGIRLEHAAGHAEAQAAETLETQAEEMLEGIIGSPDVDGSLENEGVGIRGALVSFLLFALSFVAHLFFCCSIRLASRAATGLADVGGATSGMRSGIVGPIMSLVSQAADMVSPGQLKLAMGNLQINASLTVVFAIPWPPMYTQFLEMLNVFKLDLFKGLAFAAPCLYSSHFMSLATFVAAPIVLLAVFASAFGCAAAVILITQRSSQKCKRCAKKMLFGKATLTSASGAAVKITLVVILFIYPAICSKVFTTFKCTDVGGGKLFMVSRTRAPTLLRAERLLSHSVLAPHPPTQVADMSVACFEGEWLLWAGLSGVAMLVYGALPLPRVACVSAPCAPTHAFLHALRAHTRPR